MLRPFTWYRAGTEAGYESLYRRLTDQPEVPMPPLGAQRRLPSRRPRRPFPTPAGPTSPPPPAEAPPAPPTLERALPPAPRSTPASPFVIGPAITRDADFFGREAEKARLGDALARGAAVQILGERRMGKTSLLRWVERHAAEAQTRPVAWINAQNLPGRSPMDLVGGAGRALGRSAERALAVLLPAVFLVDEAEELADPAHGFDAGARRARGGPRGRGPAALDRRRRGGDARDRHS